MLVNGSLQGPEARYSSCPLVCLRLMRPGFRSQESQ